MSTLRTDTISNSAGSSSVPVNTVINGSAKAWVNFNGTGTVAIRDSFNVSSITDNGTGDYTVNFTSALPDADYSFSGAGRHVAGTTVPVIVQHDSVNATTTAFRLQAFNGNAAVRDTSVVCINFFR